MASADALRVADVRHRHGQCAHHSERDWRYPALAAVLGCSGAYIGNLMIGVVETGRYIDEPVIRVLGGLSSDTMENFFTSTVNPIDHIYAVCAAGVAAFFANRRLNRREILAVRMMNGEK